MSRPVPRNLNESLYGPPQPGRTPDGYGWHPECCDLPMALKWDGWQCATAPFCDTGQDFGEED